MLVMRAGGQCASSTDAADVSSAGGGGSALSHDVGHVIRRAERRRRYASRSASAWSSNRAIGRGPDPGTARSVSTAQCEKRLGGASTPRRAPRAGRPRARRARGRRRRPASDGAAADSRQSVSVERAFAERREPTRARATRGSPRPARRRRGSRSAGGSSRGHRPVGGLLGPVARPSPRKIQRRHALLLAVRARRERGVQAPNDESWSSPEGGIREIVASLTRAPLPRAARRGPAKRRACPRRRRRARKRTQRPQ